MNNLHIVYLLLGYPHEELFCSQNIRNTRIFNICTSKTPWFFEKTKFEVLFFPLKINESIEAHFKEENETQLLSRGLLFYRGKNFSETGTLTNLVIDQIGR